MKKKQGKVRLTLSPLDRKIQDVRQIIIDRMKQRGMSNYRLSKLSGVTIQTIGKFVAGKYEMKTDRLSRILAALELEIRPRK